MRPLIVIILAVFSISASAQVSTGGSYTLEKTVIANGGGLSNDIVKNIFTIEGTSGQCTAGAILIGGPPDYDIWDGFWAPDIPLPTPTPTPTVTPTATPTPPPTPSPTATPSYSISGHIAYRDAGPAVNNVTITLTSPSFPTQMTTTDSNGDYMFTGLPAGNNYTVTATKAGAANGLESFDASKVARFTAGLDIPTASQVIASDADNDGIVTSFDASYIARYVAGLPGYGIVSTWKFVPANRTYTDLGGDQTNQNYTAILVGETSGNWFASRPAEGIGDETPSWIESEQEGVGNSPQPSDGITLALPRISALPGASVTVPVTVGDLTNRGVMAYDLDIEFDPSMLQPQVVAFETEGTLSDGMLVTTNGADRGHLIISAFQPTEIAGAGPLINLKFTVTGSAGQTTYLTFVDYTDENWIFHPAARLNSGVPIAVTVKGAVKIFARSNTDGSSYQGQRSATAKVAPLRFVAR
jgi:hypothetical protein